MRPRIFTVSVCAAIVILTAAGTMHGLRNANQPEAAAAAPSSVALTISPRVPPDIPGGAPSATLEDAAAFAWNEFFALNWPAKAGVRDTPDTAKLFGDQSGPLVWHTLRSKVEIFPGNGYAKRGPHGYDVAHPNPPDYGYDEPPLYVYGSTVRPCTGQSVPAQPAWINLDEVTQIALDSMFAGVVPAAPQPTNSRPQLIRFLAKANRTHYAYVVSKQYWYNNSRAPLFAAQQNFVKAIKATPPVAPTGSYVDFPERTIEVKAAWRPLAPNEDPGRFHMATVRYYEKETATCYREAQWALIALHIIQKTATAPAFIFATFEQADNILLPGLDKNGKPVPVEDTEGRIINAPAPATPTTPGLTYKDNPPATGPQVSITGASYCASPGLQLFYRNTGGQTGVPTGGNICVNRRDNAIPPDIVAVNQAAHDAIRRYNAANGIKQSPWLYYKLVNVQAYPFDKSQINTTDPNAPHNPSTFFQANIVVETNYTLQLFHGRVVAAGPGNGAPTDFPTPNVPATAAAVPPNVYVVGANNTVSAYNMGGCMGCHGNAQAAGSDFSFILNQGPVREPEFPQISPALLRPKYKTSPNQEKAMSNGALQSWQEVQAFLTKYSGQVGSAPHQSFWTALTYDQFVNGNVPDRSGQYGGPPSITNPPQPPPPPNPPVKILVKGSSKTSNIILALSGLPPFDGSVFNQMPDGGPYLPQDQIDRLAAWIDNGCPQFASKEAPREKPAHRR